MLTFERLIDMDKGGEERIRLVVPKRLNGNKQIMNYAMTNKRIGINRELVGYALSYISNLIEDVCLEEGYGLTIDGLGTFKPQVRKDRGTRISVNFLPCRGLVKHPDSLDVMYDRKIKQDGVITHDCYRQGKLTLR